MRISRAVILLALVPAAAFSQIRNTRHDMTGGTGTIKNTGTGAPNTQICIYCHTPHGARSTQFLWQRADPTWTYQWGNDLDGTSLLNTAQGTVLPTSLKAASKRCLSCHDGSIAIDQVSNQGGNAAGSTGTALSGAVWAAGSSPTAQYRVGANGNMGTNHPISVPYAGAASNTYNSRTSGLTTDINGPGNYYAVLTTGCFGVSGLCTTASGPDAIDGRYINLIRDTTNGTGIGIECPSCHEPHNRFSPNPYFTRVDVSNASSLCRSCHNK